MRLGRTLPPTAASLAPSEALHGLTGMFRRAELVSELERQFKEHFGVRHVFLVSSGKAALTVILRGLCSLRPERRGVVIPAYTCYSVPAAVLKAGLEIRLCDVDPGTLGFRREALEAAVDADTLCVVPTHLFGAPTDLEAARALGAARGCFVVEDAAQAMGARKDGRFLGTIGDVGFFSLGRGKNLNAGGGGVILTDDDGIAGAIGRHCASLRPAGAARELTDFALLLLQSILIDPRLYWIPSGLPFLGLGETIYPEDFPVRPLSGYHAGVLRGWRGRLERDIERRKENSDYFIAHLPGRGAWTRDTPYLRLPLLVESREARDALHAEQRDSGVGVMYPEPISEVRQVRQRLGACSCPAAELVAERLVTIPTHHLLSARDREGIVQAIGRRARREACPPAGNAPC